MEREIDGTVASCLLTLSEGLENVRAELAATKMALGIALAHADQATMLQLRGMASMADDLTVNLRMTERQREVFRAQLQETADSVANAQALMYPGGLRGLVVAFAYRWANLRRTLVGAPWNGGIVRGLVLRLWTLGTARKAVRYEAMGDEALARAKMGRP
jgi:hypothetical protein